MQQEEIQNIAQFKYRHMGSVIEVPFTLNLMLDKRNMIIIVVSAILNRALIIDF